MENDRSRVPGILTRFRLDGATAFVTGAGSGIGRATAIACAEAGAATVFLCGRTSAKLAATAAQISAANTRTVIVPGDVTNADDRLRFVKTVRDANVTLDLLVNNAGLFDGLAIEATTDAVWRVCYESNVEAPFALIRDFLPAIAASRLKAVVNVGSTLAVKPIPVAAAYSSAKAALAQMTRSLALELGPRGVRVNCVHPAIIETPMYRGRYPTDASYTQGMADAAKLHPLGRVGQPEDIAAAILFLASPAASWITGVELNVDGGMLVT